MKVGDKITITGEITNEFCGIMAVQFPIIGTVEFESDETFNLSPSSPSQPAPILSEEKVAQKLCEMFGYRWDWLPENDHSGESKDSFRNKAKQILLA